MNDILGFVWRVVSNIDVLQSIQMLGELFDFMIKASAAYRLTPEGQKEWNDFAVRYEMLVNNEAGGETVSYSVENVQPTKSGDSRRFPIQE